jgi:hypothetical protein
MPRTLLAYLAFDSNKEKSVIGDSIQCSNIFSSPLMLWHLADKAWAFPIDKSFQPGLIFETIGEWGAFQTH